MKFNRTAFALSMVLAATGVVATPALAKDKGQKEAAPAERKYDISSGALKAIGELQTAVNANDVANIPAKLAAAQAVAKTNDDKYIIAKLHLQAAIAAKDNATILNALEAVAASGAADQTELGQIYLNAGQLAYNAKDYARASTNINQALKLNPNNVDAYLILGESLNATGHTEEGVAAIRKATALKVASGQKPEESWYKRSVALANEKNLPVVNDAAMEWVKAYPTSKNWRDLLRIYIGSHNMDDLAAIDVSRLMFTANALVSEADYYRLANPLVAKGFPGEAKAVLDQGIAAKTISRQSPTINALYAASAGKIAGDQASLTGAAKTALAQPAASKVVVIADAYAGYGDYAKALDLYKAALGKTGADKDLINLRMGMALAKSGDKAGATAALNAVTGTQAGVAKLWLAYLSTKA